MMDPERAAAVVDELFESWYPHLVRYAIRLTGQPATAEEIVQDAFFDLFQALQVNAGIRHPKAWTMTVVRNKAFDRQRDPFGVDHPHADLEDWPGATSVLGDQLQTMIDRQRVRAYLSLLTPREEEVLLLRLQSLKYREIGSALGLSVNSVNTLLARAISKIRTAIARDSVSAASRRTANG